MHLFITGTPGSGKTTLIKSLIPYLKNSCGFFTEEIRESEQRIGFKIKTLDGQERILAHQDFKSSYKVSKYGVDLQGLERVIEHLHEQIEYSQIVVIDEIGKMEWGLNLFRDFVKKLLNSNKKIIATISEKGKDFEEIKKRKDVFLFRLNKENFKEVFRKVVLAKDALSSQELRSLDEKAKKILGLPETVLIENASRACLETLLGVGPLPKKAGIFSGRGNNSADSLALARHLLNRGVDLKIFLVLGGKSFNKEVEFQLNILRKVLSVEKIKILNEREELVYLEKIIPEFDLVVDGIFGTGFKKPLAPFYKELIRLINQKARKILAVDIPSGLPADNLEIDEEVIKAFLTVTFLAPKISFFLEGGSQYTGEIIVKDIGVSRDVLQAL
ncbi:MAG: NTPase [Candidatus Omnitrophica bacterium]|nr:NTPase [Candidatus Omnitrophota bacterium]